jgi:hypothetical protein
MTDSVAGGPVTFVSWELGCVTGWLCRHSPFLSATGSPCARHATATSMTGSGTRSTRKKRTVTARRGGGSGTGGASTPESRWPPGMRCRCLASTRGRSSMPAAASAARGSPWTPISTARPTASACSPLSCAATASAERSPGWCLTGRSARWRRTACSLRCSPATFAPCAATWPAASGSRGPAGRPCCIPAAGKTSSSWGR